MLAFLDFEASSLARDSYPIEVAWVFEDGASEAHLVRPLAGWTDWDPGAERMHGLARARLEAEGEPAGVVAGRMLAQLSGHSLCASAPSWDGKWLSVLLRAAGLPRHALRLEDSDAVHIAAAREMLQAQADPADLDRLAAEVVEAARAALAAEPVRHRALADAERERRLWLEARRRAGEWTSLKSASCETPATGHARPGA
jgi:hypothetical protein